MVNTLQRVKNLAKEKNTTLFKLAQESDVSYCTLRNAETRGSQLTVDTIERLCGGLNITLSEFFA